ncbi:hypothetical protein NPIL_547131 [Nephila pilipes]|uniref:Uncharacterized protein n=1 Tax=Nephila pilipes TaxID=299642 RepID=A0A8X6UJF7_NEPPI|nr:hypothetical protein NPIL_547131 [Nephila pilipes]
MFPMGAPPRDTISIKPFSGPSNNQFSELIKGLCIGKEMPGNAKRSFRMEGGLCVCVRCFRFAVECVPFKVTKSSLNRGKRKFFRISSSIGGLLEWANPILRS